MVEVDGVQELRCRLIFHTLTNPAASTPSSNPVNLLEPWALFEVACLPRAGGLVARPDTMVHDVLHGQEGLATPIAALSGDLRVAAVWSALR